MDNELLNILWIIVASGLVFLMQAGFACLESGLTRSKNSINVAVKNISDLGIAVLLYWCFGFALMFGLSRGGWLGSSEWLTPFENDAWLAVFFLFQAMFCATAATIVSGAVAERMRYGSYIIVTIIVTGLIYPIFGHWSWGGAYHEETPGILQSIGFVDFAGSTVVHSVGGWVAFAAVLILGPRAGRFPEEGEPKPIHGHDLPVAILGALLLWFGWFGFNGGSTLAMDRTVPGIIANTVLASATGLVTAVIIGWPIKKVPDISLPINGSLAGLVAITANCHAVTSLEAALIGSIGAIVMLGTEWLLERNRIDDVIGAIPVHLAAGAWGTLAVGIFGDPEVLGTNLGYWNQIGIQAAGIAACGVWSFGVGYLLIYIADRIYPLRVSAEDERVGLNVSEHRASTEILDLFSAMDEQARSGDMSIRVPVEPFTEVGQIADRYNLVMSSLEQTIQEKEEILNNDLLKNVVEGLFTVRRDGTIGPQYSRAFTQLIGHEDPAGHSFRTLAERFVAEENAEAIQDFLDLAFAGRLKGDGLERLNPLRDVSARFEGREQDTYLRFQFLAIKKDGKVKHLLGQIVDITRERNLAREIEAGENRRRQEMERAFSILHVDPSLLAEFIEDVRGELERIGKYLRAGEGDHHKRLEKIYRPMHKIKGNASLLKIDFIADTAHEFEEKIETARAKTQLSPTDFLPLVMHLKEIHIQIDEVRALVDRLLAFRDSFQTQATAERFLSQVEEAATELATQLGKQVRLDTGQFDQSIVPGDYRAFLRDVLVQLVRNSISHGIETPEERRRLGKSGTGLIRLGARLLNQNFELDYQDDGTGIQVERLRARLIEKGLMDRESAAALSEQELARLIFRSGVSTAGEAGMQAGRGVGMDFIRASVKKFGGRILTSFKPGSFTRFRIILPVNG